MGKWRTGSSFSVYLKENEEHLFEEQFVVNEGQKFYEIVIPFYTPVSILVKDQKKVLLSNYKIVVNYKNQSKEYTTDRLGKVNIERLEAGEFITVSDAKNLEISSNYTIEKEKNVFEFYIIQPVNATIKVIDNKGNLLPDYKITISQPNEEKEYTSNQEAMVELQKLQPNSKIVITEEKYKNKQEYTINELEEKNDFEFIVNIPEKKKIKLTLIDHKKHPIANRDLTINFKAKEYKLKTDQNGVCFIYTDEILPKDFLKIALKAAKKEKIRKLKWLK